MVRLGIGLFIVLLFGTARELNWVVFAGMVAGILVMLWGLSDLESKGL